MFRVAVALVASLIGLVLIYGLGGGYFQIWGIKLSSPWNFIGSIVLMVVLLLAVWRILPFSGSDGPENVRNERRSSAGN